MRYRKFGKTDLEVSEIGFGAWAIGGGAMIGSTAIGWGKADDATSVRAIHAALDAGINFFDTADIYGLGHSEELLGKVLGSEKDIILATKGGNVSRNGQFTIDYTKEHLIRACESSLRRLKRETIDYYQLHSARSQHLEDGQCLSAMETLQKQGKIRYWGLSLNTFDPEPEANYLMQQGKGNGFQLVLNLINLRALPLLKPAGEKGIGIIARMPLQFGLLTGKFDQGIEFSITDHRKNRLPPALVKETSLALEPVWRLCSKYHCSKTQLALSFVLGFEEVSVVIAGIRNEEQVKENTRGFFTVDAEDRKMIEELSAREGLMEKIRELG